eukprot:616179_1
MGLINVQSSNGWYDGEAKQVVARDVNRLNSTPNEKNGCIVIWFHKNSIQSTAYTWRHDTNVWKYPRNWDFEGSNDDVTWDILRRHVNDEQLQHGINATKAYASHTWTITNCNKSYKMFRFKITGTNSSGTYHIMCGGFEIYGRLKL